MISKWCSILRYWLFDSGGRVHDSIYNIIFLKIPFSSVGYLVFCMFALFFAIFHLYMAQLSKVSWKRMKISILFEILQIWNYPCLILLLVHTMLLRVLKNAICISAKAFLYWLSFFYPKCFYPKKAGLAPLLFLYLYDRLHQLGNLNWLHNGKL